jgi:hypothetical protein
MVGVTQARAQFKLLYNKVIREVCKIQPQWLTAILPSIIEAEALKTGGEVVATTIKIGTEDFQSSRLRHS